MRRYQRPRARFLTAEAREALLVIAVICAAGAVSALAIAH